MKLSKKYFQIGQVTLMGDYLIITFGNGDQVRVSKKDLEASEFADWEKLTITENGLFLIFDDTGHEISAYQIRLITDAEFKEYATNVGASWLQSFHYSHDKDNAKNNAS